MIVAYHAFGSDLRSTEAFMKNWFVENWLWLLIGGVAACIAMKAGSAADQLLRGVSVVFEVALDDPIVPPE